MTVAVWPTTLPEGPTTNYRGGPQDARASFQPERGPTIDRRITTGAAKVFSMTLAPLTRAQLAIFETWFEDETAHGANTFSWRDPLDDTPQLWKFMKADPVYNIDALSDEMVSVSFSLMRYPGTPWFASYLQADSNKPPPLVLDFENGKYGLSGDRKSLNRLITTERASPGTYYDANGVLQTAGDGMPRVDHDPVTNAVRGLLVESEAINLLLRSQEFGTSWTLSGCSATDNDANSPDGTANAEKIVEDTSTGRHGPVQNVTVAASTEYTWSVYAKADERSELLLREDDQDNMSARFNLSTGATSGASGCTSAIEDVGGGWYRCSITGTTAGGQTTFGCDIRMHNGTSSSYTGDGSSGLHVFGAQLEARPHATSYIATTTAAVTRPADTCYLTLGTWFSATEGSIIADGRTLIASEDDSYIARFDDGSSANSIWAMIQSANRSQFRVTVASSVVANIQQGGASSEDESVKIAAAFKANDFASSLEGASVATDSAGAMPTGLTTFRLGASHSTERLDGWVKKIVYYDERLSNTLLESLSA